MNRFIAIGATLVLVVGFSISRLRAEEFEDLKSVHHALIQARNSRDARALTRYSHPDLVVYLLSAAFPFDGRDIPEPMLEAAWQTAFDLVERIEVTAINPIYIVVGTTGVVTSHERVVVKPVDGPLKTQYSRVTSTYVRQDDVWLLLSHHESPITSGDR